MTDGEHLTDSYSPEPPLESGLFRPVPVSWRGGKATFRSLVWAVLLAVMLASAVNPVPDYHSSQA